jgi:hypothetical protein
MGLLMKCANCSRDGFYIYQLTLKTQVFYCNLHLPKFLKQAKKAGLIKTTDALKSVIEEGIKNMTPLVTEEPVVEEPVVEEPLVEEAPTPKPKKKAAKKKAE